MFPMPWPSAVAIHGDIPLAITAMAAALREREAKRKLEREAEEMFKPGGFGCHAWPFPLVRPYEYVRWASDSRQQRRARAGKEAKANRRRVAV
jgi:hypothetical protein